MAEIAGKPACAFISCQSLPAEARTVSTKHLDFNDLASTLGCSPLENRRASSFTAEDAAKLDAEAKATPEKVEADTKGVAEVLDNAKGDLVCATIIKLASASANFLYWTGSQHYQFDLWSRTKVC